MASLRELQRSFAAALRDPAVACPVLPPANLAVYRNNASITFRETLEHTYPVLHRRVGDDYFRQLAAQYRQVFPSRQGDLHWVGRDFAAFIHEHLAGTDYAWLADLAQLEWLRAESGVAAESPALDAEALASIAPEHLEGLTFGLQPSLRLLSSPFPVFSVWRSNQGDVAPPVDQSLGAEAGMILQWRGRVEVRPLEHHAFVFISALAAGRTLGAAMSEAELDEHALTRLLATLFGEGLVSSLAVSEADAAG